MADFPGQYSPSAIYSNEHLNPDFGNGTAPPDYLIGTAELFWLHGTLANTQPVVENQTAVSGQIGNVFGFLDWYNRIHVQPLSVDLGNIVSVQQRTISVWNAFFVTVTLNALTPANDEGLTLTEPQAPPFDFAALEEVIYLLEISTVGPATVDASYVFDFNVADFTVTVLGVRVVAWAWEPNWIDPVLERLAWNTDVMTAYDGSEQRTQLRDFPRAEWEFTFDIQEGQRRSFENILFGWGARVWALPVWTDGELRVTPISSGATSIVLPTAGRDYHVAGIGMVIGPDGSFESFEVDVVQVAQIDLARPLVSTWPVGSKVYPARTARLVDPRSTARFTRSYARGNAHFRTAQEIERSELSETLYRGLPVMEREPNWRDAPEIDYMRKLVAVDFNIGRDFIDDEAEIALPSPSFRWTMLDRDEADYFRSWIYARRGRARGIWLPTWCNDLILAVAMSAAQVNIDVEAAGVTYFAQGLVHRTDIRIELNNGTVFYRRVINPVVVDAATERMTMNTSLGVIVQTADVARISWMHFVRLDTDSVEITWHTPAVAEAAVILKGPRHEF